MARMTSASWSSSSVSGAVLKEIVVVIVFSKCDGLEVPPKCQEFDPAREHLQLPETEVAQIVTGTRSLLAKQLLQDESLVAFPQVLA